MSLIEKLEQAEEGSRELDAEVELLNNPRADRIIHEILDGPYIEDENGGYYGEAIPHYTTSIDAALTLVPEGAEYEITTLYGVARVAVGLNFMNGPGYGTRQDRNAPIAICIASLRAREAGE